ncbi:MAG: PhnD/SsuA/transferrin family substrate-binding protein [Nitrospirota bacterium]|jgi:two-component system sensor histidine kinase TtrS
MVAIRVFLLLALCGGGIGGTPSWAAERSVTIGVLAYRGAENCLQRWSPTARYLSEAIAGYTFHIEPLTLEEVSTAAQRGDVDFILTNTGNYVALEARYGISRIATLRAPGEVAAGNVFGAVIFTRADRHDIQTLRDIEGKRFMAVKPDGFGGFQMAWRELKDHDIDPFEDFAELRFSGFPQERVAFAVRDGRVDAGTFRTGSLDALEAEGKIELSEFRVLNARHYPGFPFAVSTRLYPEWPFSRLHNTPHDLAQNVAIALLSMPADSPAAREGVYGGWTVPLDYTPVHDLFRELRIGPYQDLGNITVADVFKYYGPWIVLAAVILVLTATWAAWIEFLVTRRTRELSLANQELERQVAERRRAEEVARQRQAELAHAARLNAMGEMASELAHELNHPLATIHNYARGCIRRLRAGESDTMEMLDALEQVSGQADRAAELIRSIRDFVHKENRQLQSTDLNEIIREVAGLLDLDAQNSGISVALHLAEPPPRITADVIQIEQAIFNLARNAIEAMSGQPAGQRRLSIATTVNGGGTVEVSVRDTGAGVPQNIQENMFNPFVSTKRGGMGLGLSITRSIVEAHHGSLWVAASNENGSDMRFTLPIES